MELRDVLSHLREHLLTDGRDVVSVRAVASRVSRSGLEQAGTLHPVQQRIERSRAYVVSVLAELLKQVMTNRALVAGVVEDVDFPQTQDELTQDTVVHPTFVNDRRRRSSCVQLRRCVRVNERRCAWDGEDVCASQRPLVTNHVT